MYPQKKKNITTKAKLCFQWGKLNLPTLSALLLACFETWALSWKQIKARKECFWMLWEIESTPCKTSTYSVMDQSSELMFKRLQTNFMISRQAHSTRGLLLLQKWQNYNKIVFKYNKFLSFIANNLHLSYSSVAGGACFAVCFYSTHYFHAFYLRNCFVTMRM